MDQAPVRRVLWVAVAVLLVVGAVLGARAALAASNTDPRVWGDTRIDGRQVQLDFTGSECQADAWADVEESVERVVITVQERVRIGDCNDVGVAYTVTVGLDEPLGDRELVDGACVEGRWVGTPVCEEKAG